MRVLSFFFLLTCCVVFVLCTTRSHVHDPLEQRMTALETRIQKLEMRNTILEEIEKLFGDEKNGDLTVLTQVKELQRRVQALEKARDQPENLEAMRYKEERSNVNTIEGNGSFNSYKIKRQGNGNKIAFCAGLSTYHISNLAPHDTIQFDHVFTNAGNAYSRYSGIFRVPVSGTYVMSIAFCAGEESGEHQRYLEIVANGSPLGDIVLDSAGQFMATSFRMWIFHFNAGDDVWVRTTSYNPNPNVHGRDHSMFTGWLLFAD